MIDTQQSHAYKAQKKEAILDQIDQNFLNDMITFHCKDTLELLRNLDS
jgi:hypothetical protein